MIIGKSLTALGGGGLKPEIRVTAKAGALLNLRYKDSSIILQSYQLGAEETQHTFVVSVSATSYVVDDATNGKSVEVLVDAVALFNVKIAYKLYLYNSGDECTDVTGGWTAISYSNVYAYKRSNYMEISTSNYSGEALLETNNAIDLSGYSTLHVLYDRTQVTYKVVVYVMSAKQTTGYINTGTTLARINLPKTIVTGAEAELDVSNVESGYIVLNGDNSAKFYQVWLE